MSLSCTPLSSLKTNLLLEVVTLRKIGLSRGLFSLWNCWYFFSFSLLSCMVKSSWIWVRACWFAIGKMSWTHPEQLPGSKSALPLDISFTHHRPLGTYVTWLKSDLRMLSIYQGICDRYHMVSHTICHVPSSRIDDVLLTVYFY